MNIKLKLRLLYLILFISFNSFSQTIIRGPYLQKGTETSVVVRWRSDSNTPSVIEYSLNSDFSSKVVLPVNPVASPATGYDYTVEITGLSPNTKYYYRIGNNGSLSSGITDLYFKTHPTIGTSGSYRFWVLGDCGTGDDDDNAEDVRDAYYSYITTNSYDTDGMLFLGDNAYLDGTDAQFQVAVFDTYPDILKNTISWSCFGNHEGWWLSPSDLGYPVDFTGSPYYDIYTFPVEGESGGMASGTEAYYSFDYGNIHFMVLDSFGTDRSATGAMHTWAENDIQNTTQKWIVAFWHHPPYSKGSHDSDTEIELIEMRENFLPMLEANGVDLVLAGHSHSYERSYFINGHYGDSDTFSSTTHTIETNGGGDGKIGSGGAYNKTSFGTNAGKGAVYVVTGSAGKTSAMESIPHEAMYYSVRELGSSIIELDGENLTLQFLDKDGNIDDYFTINKGPDYTFNGSWSPGTLPTATNIEDIHIKSGSATITDNISARSVVVDPGAGLTINSGKTLTVANSINLNSQSSKYSSLISNGSINGTGAVNYNRFTNKIGTGTSGGNDLVSPPLSGQSFVAFSGENPMLAFNPTPGSESEKAFAPFNNVSGNYENYDTDSGPGLIATLTEGEGYRAATTIGSPLKFTGTVNNGIINSPITIGAISEWNLIGNPYPSYIKLDEFLSENNGKFNTSYAGIYGYDGNIADGWSIWNAAYSTLNPNSVITPGQGFFVAAAATGPVNVTFTPVMRSTGTTDDFIAGRITETNVALAKLDLINADDSYNTDIYFIDGATRGLDPGYDTGAFQGNAAGIFTHLVVENTGVEMAIQSLRYEDFNNVVVPLGIKSNAGEQISIGLDGSSTLPENINVYLEDNVANTLTLLNTGNYTMTPTEDLNSTGRFYINFSSGTLSLEDREMNDLQIYTSAYPKSLFVNGLLTERTTAELYDLQGRLVLNRILDLNNNSNEIDISTISTGIYVVKVKMGGILKTQKVIIR
jgi:hypothetical protein